MRHPATRHTSTRLAWVAAAGLIASLGFAACSRSPHLTRSLVGPNPAAGAAPAKRLPPTPSGTPVLASVTFLPTSVQGGSPATGRITFDRITDGAVVQLVSGNAAVVSVPAEMVVSGGQSSGDFPVTTSAVAANTVVSVTASAFGTTTRSGSITVTTATAPPATDVVKITRAEWKQGLLRIEATGTNTSAILSVYLTASGSFMLNLTNNGGGRYSDQRGWVTNPESITVRSNFGGSATAATTG